MLDVESAVYTYMRQICPGYAGGYWRFLELSNGGCYLAPEVDVAFDLRVDGNGFKGAMSADAAGITACLFALSHLSFRISEDCIADRFHLLRDFALSHREARAILAAID
jgi:Antirestriction protein